MSTVDAPVVVVDAEPESVAVPTTWVEVAGESQAFALSASTLVRYGSGTQWVQKLSPQGTVNCSTGHFGSDPAPAMFKQCQVQRPVSDPTPPATPLVLPLELLNDGSPRTPAVAAASLSVDVANLAAVSQLAFTCHRCGFFGAPEFEATTDTPVRIKASVRVLGGARGAEAAGVPWTDVTEADVRLADLERLQGGLNRGGFYTARMTLALDAAARARLVASPGGNLVQFRFNGTEGESNGYRIIALQWQDTQGRAVGSDVPRYADIGLEKAAGRAWTADAAAGEALWSGRGQLLKSSIVPRRIEAACASCHSATGRDLQYFNYSNNAIVQRSRFHGLSEQQGRQIAAYLRYSQRDVPHVAQAAPWNPPYQPGAGLDARPLAEWAAGAGLGAVLDTPAQAIRALFGQPVNDPAVTLTQAQVDAVMDPGATMNAREIAVPLQYPDWNAWLPTLHPLDVWPAGADPAGSFEAGAQFSQSSRQDPQGHALRVEAWLKANRNPNGVHGDWSHLTPIQRNEVQQLFANSGWVAYGFLGGGRGNHIAGSGEYGAQAGARHLTALRSNTTAALDPDGTTPPAFIERAVMSMLHWNAVQQWDWAQTYGLEGNQQWFIGDYDATARTWHGRGEARGWPFNTVSLFYLAPHMQYQEDRAIGRDNILAWEQGNRVGSYYRTNIWYQMQMSVNPGAQGDWVNFSMDWPYLTAFDELLAGTLGSSTPAHQQAAMMSNVRLLQARIKGAQFVNNAIPLYVVTDTRSLADNRGRFGRAQALKHLTPVNFMARATTLGSAGTPFADFDRLAPGLHLKVVNGAIRQFNGLYAATAPGDWRRCDPANTDLGESEPTAGFAFCVDRARTPLAQTSPGNYAMNVDAYWRASPEQSHQYGLWKAGQMGAEAQRLQVWRDWTERIWP